MSDILVVARTEALVLSEISASATLTRQIVSEAIRHQVRVHGGVRGCAADFAAYYATQPEVAAPRTRWARSVVEDLFTH